MTLNTKITVPVPVLSFHGFKTNQFNDLLPVGLLAQLVERCTSIIEVKSSNSVQFFFSGFLLAAAEVASITAMIYLHIITPVLLGNSSNERDSTFRKYIICKQLDKFLPCDVNYLYEKSWRLCFGCISYRLTYYINGAAVFVRYRRHAASSTSTSYCHDIWAISHAATVWLRAFQTEASSRETRSVRRKDGHSESCLSIRHSRTKGHCRCVDSSWLFVCCCCCFL